MKRPAPPTDALRQALLRWYATVRRPLPWRETRDPYAIWLSEVMLQQTTVRTVEPRWRRFLERYPTVRHLADAPLDEVLAEWSGLGYYARARNLHAAARRVRTDFSGELPRRFELLLALPGMGRYTAAAVASIAFDEPVAVLDANVERVLARLDAVPDDIRQPATKRRLWDRAQALLDPEAPGDWNQAMMELGALACTPRAALCPQCPMRRWCVGHALGEPDAFPVKSAKPAMQDAREVAVIVRRGTDVLVVQRPHAGSFAGFWELPRGEAAPGERPAAAATRVLAETTGLAARPVSVPLVIRHTVMRTRIELHVVEAELSDPNASARVLRHDDVRWLDPAEWLSRPISTSQRRIARWLLGGGEPVAQASPDDDTPDLFGG